MDALPESGGRRWGVWIAAFAAGVAVFSAARFAWGPLGRRSSPPAPFPRAPIEPFGQLEIEHTELPESGVVPIALALAEPSANANPLPASLLSMSDKRMMQTQARLNEARTVATVEIDRAWLLPGSYLVQLRTTERSTMPLRRYAIVVR